MKRKTTQVHLAIASGLALAGLLWGVGSVHAAEAALQPLQVKNTGYISAKGTITVAAACPINYQVQSGNVEINGYTSGTNNPQAYKVNFNGADLKANAWTTTITNPSGGSLDLTVTATCIAQEGK